MNADTTIDNWRDLAACRGADPGIFFPEESDSYTLLKRQNARSNTVLDRSSAGKRICASCPVRAECLDHAIAADERFGVWGGLSAVERRIITRHPPEQSGGGYDAAPVLALDRPSLRRARHPARQPTVRRHDRCHLPHLPPLGRLRDRPSRRHRTPRPTRRPSPVRHPPQVLGMSDLERTSESSFDADMSWATRGDCSGHKHPEWWFPTDEHHAAGYDLARKVCASCPVLAQCQVHGLEHELHGMWGGLTARQRQDVRRGHPIPTIGPQTRSDRGIRRGRRPSVTPERAEQIRSAEGNYRMIAEQFGISRTTVVNIRTGQGPYALQNDAAPPTSGQSEEIPQPNSAPDDATSDSCQQGSPGQSLTAHKPSTHCPQFSTACRSGDPQTQSTTLRTPPKRTEVPPERPSMKPEPPALIGDTTRDQAAPNTGGADHG